MTSVAHALAPSPPKGGVVYEREFTATGSIKVFAVHSRLSPRDALYRKLVAIAHAPLEADRAERKHDLFLELCAMAREEPSGHRYWRLATLRLRSEKEFPHYVRYQMKRAALGLRFRDIVDPRQLSLSLRG